MLGFALRCGNLPNHSCSLWYYSIFAICFVYLVCLGQVLTEVIVRWHSLLAYIVLIHYCSVMPPNKPLEWKGLRRRSASPPQDPYLPLMGSVRLDVERVETNEHFWPKCIGRPAR